LIRKKPSSTSAGRGFEVWFSRKEGIIFLRGGETKSMINPVGDDKKKRRGFLSGGVFICVSFGGEDFTQTNSSS